jgi:hypothetical protein
LEVVIKGSFIFHLEFGPVGDALHFTQSLIFRIEPQKLEELFGLRDIECLSTFIAHFLGEFVKEGLQFAWR